MMIAPPKMTLNWTITEQDIARTTAFVEQHKANSFVLHRIQKNVNGSRPPFTRDAFWQQMLACLLTSQQRSGPESAVSKLIHSDPFPLCYSACSSCDSASQLVRSCLSQYGGIRRYEHIADEASENLARLENGLWAEVERAWADLAEADDPVLERKAARLIDSELKGFGPKQARNLLQGLGLTRYEIPIDSRVGKRLVEIGFPLAMSPQMLLVPEVYELVLDGVQELCRKCGIYPCVLDAAMFASFDANGWDGVKVIW